MKAMLRGKFVAISAYIKKHGRSQIDNITLQLADLEKEKQTKVKAGRRKKIPKSKAEINEIENSKTIRKKKAMKSRVNFLKTQTKFDKLLVRLIKEKGEKT